MAIKPRVEARQINGRWRVVDQTTGKPALHQRSGKLIDGGGHGTDRAKAERQVGHVNKDAGEAMPA